MKKQNVVASIDVGTTKICTILADVDDVGGPRVVGVGISPSKGLHKGLVVNISEARESIRDSVRKSETMHAYRVLDSSLAINGVASRNNMKQSSVTGDFNALGRGKDTLQVIRAYHAVVTGNSHHAFVIQ